MSSIISTVHLVKAGDRWTFSSEAELENFVWNNLHLLGLRPLKKQYFISGQYCDILAVDSNSQLVIIELKNAEDRYIVQQLTRYYDALLQERTFEEAIDYSKPPRLMAIYPSFHRDNLIDRRYHKLEIDFLRFEIVFRDDKFIFVLKDIDSNKTLETNIFYNLQKQNINISQPPRKLLNIISALNEDRQKNILDIRNQILGFDERIKEIVFPILA